MHATAVTCGIIHRVDVVDIGHTADTRDTAAAAAAAALVVVVLHVAMTVGLMTSAVYWSRVNSSEMAVVRCCAAQLVTSTE